MMYSTYKLKQGNNIQPRHTPFRMWNQSVVPCPVLTVASWPAYRFLRRRVRWSGIPISLRIFHSLLWSTHIFGIVNKAKVDIFLELSCWERLKAKGEGGSRRCDGLDSITDPTDMSLSKLQKIAEDRGAWCAAVHGVTESQTWLRD